MAKVFPGFENGKDRLAYLLAEYKVPTTMLVVGASVYMIQAQPDLEVPVWVSSFATALIFPGVPTYFASRKIVKWLRKRNWVTVQEIDPARGVMEPHVVPPSVWKERETEEYPAWSPRGSDETDYVVRKFEYKEDIGQLRVDGVWLGNIKPEEIVRAENMLDETYGYLQREAEEAHRYRAIMSSIGTRVQERVVNAVVEAQEKGTQMDRDAISGAVDDAMGNISEESAIERPELEEVADIEVGGAEAAAEEVEADE